MRPHNALILLSLAALFLGGCATITRGTTNQVTFQSEPSEAEMRTTAGQTCITPCTLTIDRKAEFTAVFRKEGYHEAQIPVQTRIAGSGAAGFAGNVLVGGIVGMAADAATGATLEHTPNPVIANMTPIHKPAHRPVRRILKRARPTS